MKDNDQGEIGALVIGMATGIVLFYGIVQVMGGSVYAESPNKMLITMDAASAMVQAVNDGIKKGKELEITVRELQARIEQMETRQNNDRR